MAQVVALGEPVNEAERAAIRFLREKLPDNYLLIHSFELRIEREKHEIDIALLTPHGLFLVDVKNTAGTIHVTGPRWYPDGRAPYFSPLAKLRQHARALKGLLQEHDSALRSVYIEATVLLTHPSAKLVDYDQRDEDDAVRLEEAVAYFTDPDATPERFASDITALLPKIRTVIEGEASGRTGPKIFGQWKVEERLGAAREGDSAADDDRTRGEEYRVRHTLLGESAPLQRLRLWRFDPYAPPTVRDAELTRLSNGYRTLARLPGHPNVVGVKEMFRIDEEHALACVFEEPHGEALQTRLHTDRQGAAWTFDQKLRVIRDVLKALEHVHQSKVVHRNLTPDSIVVTPHGEARLTDFDFGRVDDGKTHESTVGPLVAGLLNQHYLAPECRDNPSLATSRSDLYSAGWVFAALLLGEVPKEETLPALSQLRPELSPTLDSWIATLSHPDPGQRFASATEALRALEQALADTQSPLEPPPAAEPTPTPRRALLDVTALEPGDRINNRFVVERKLGSGTFGIAYKVVDSIADLPRVIKFITYDRASIRKRFLREYRALSGMAPHRNVVEVIWGDFLPDGTSDEGTPYLVFGYVEGYDVGRLLEQRALAPDDAKRLTLDAATGLEHLHATHHYHLDVKPSNLLWTERGAILIDFNVATGPDVSGGLAGTRRYFPPDFDLTQEPTESEKADRDLYALGLTLAECLAASRGLLPQEGPLQAEALLAALRPPSSDSLTFSEELLRFLERALAPRRTSRFASATAFHEALANTPILAAPHRPAPQAPVALTVLNATKPNTNPFVALLQTLYSQNPRTNAGTRGLDEIGNRTYVPTRLDSQLGPALQAGHHALVLITGNAGDGKTAFLQSFERQLQQQPGCTERARTSNGAVLELHGRTFRTNHDGSQDEGSRTNEVVLAEFFQPYQGEDESTWPTSETRIIAINEGRLIDFLAENRAQFPRLERLVREGFQDTGERSPKVLLINLNVRSLVGDLAATDAPSLFAQTLTQMLRPAYWEDCTRCSLRERCFVHHNVRTLQDPTAGPKIAERLELLFTLTHLRGRLHITLRDLRSALAFLLVGTRDCDALHNLYAQGTPEARTAILDGFYFNAWRGGSTGSQDRLLSLLAEIDMGQSANPELDRPLVLFPPEDRATDRLSFTQRPAPAYDGALLQLLFEDLPRDLSTGQRSERVAQHRRYLAMMRRRHYFERRDNGWTEMLPYRHAADFATLIRGGGALDKEKERLLAAINQGEGITEAVGPGEGMVLRVRRVERGTIRSYRFFPGENFTVERVPVASDTSLFLEALPPYLLLEYRETGTRVQKPPTLRINLDIYEMLRRLGDGYRPSVEELEGFYLSLGIFKNALASAPYKEVLLTETGREFYRIRREDTGALRMEHLRGGASAWR